MLGYVRAYKPELKFKEYDVYKGVYCTLCKTLLRRYSPLGQLFLSYDAAFLALVLLAISPTCPEQTPSRCCYNPAKRCLSCGRGDIQDYCADVSVLLFYYKILDDLHDKGLKHRTFALLLWPAAVLMHRKAARLRPQAEEIIRDSMRRQTQAEQENAGLDAAADPSASALSKLGALRSDDEAFHRFCFLLGRFVYVIDAVDDVRSDIRKKNFNPLKARYLEAPDTFADYAMQLLNLNIAELLKAYDRLQVSRYGPVVYNVVFDGLYNSALFVVKKYKNKEADA
ncbi:MAG: hypothetical protein IJT44_11130 [Clostridia bacterium]|nr:hypothetical protein [Clostridia bacterium]